LHALKVVYKSLKLWVLLAICSQESKRQNTERIYSRGSIIGAHIDENSFLISQLFILLHFGVKSELFINLIGAIFAQIVDVLLLFPLSPNEIGFSHVAVMVTIPPVPLLND
jgi:hypothetical protein